VTIAGAVAIIVIITVTKAEAVALLVIITVTIAGAEGPVRLAIASRASVGAVPPIYTSILLAANRSVTLFLAPGLINAVVYRLAIIIFNVAIRVICDIAIIRVEVNGRGAIRVEVNDRGAIMTIVKRCEVGL